MDGLWRIDTDPLKKNYGGDNGPGLQINFSPSALTGLNVGVALPVPGPNSRRTVKAKDAYWKWVDKDGKDKADASLVATDKAVYVPAKSASWTTWGPTYPLMNAAFGLRLKDTIPGLDIGTELDLLGNEYTNGKLDDTDPTNDADEKEGDFMGMNFHLTAVYTFAPVTLRAALLVEGIANGVQNAPEPLTSVGARLIFDIPNGEGSALDLGDPWVQFQMLPNEYVTLNNNWGKVRNDDGYLIVAAKEEKSFKDILIDFEWEPSYSLSDSIKAYLWLGVGYKVWADAPDNSDQKKYPLTVAVRPALEFKFAPSATLKIQDKVSFVRQAKEKGLKNELGLRFAWKF
jgi:hypothetical protein